MRAVDVIVKTRSGVQLSREEVRFLLRGYVDGSIPEYQVSAWLMAVFFRGLSADETAILTEEIIASGETIDLSAIDGPFVDKHSTGGVGDKVSLMLAPIVAECGVRVPMMSGRSLGHTGGTLDKLESIPGYRTDLSVDRFRQTIERCGYAMTGQSREIVPADRLLYALRDVTGTVESIPLITGSILSKKFAEGAEGLVFDVKFGDGAFMKTVDDARTLAESLVRVGRRLGRSVRALLTDMETPLGSMVGNSLEVEEAVWVLDGLGLVDDAPAAAVLTPGQVSRVREVSELTIRLAARMLTVAGVESDDEAATVRCRQAVTSGRAFDRFLRNVVEQGGDAEWIEALRQPIDRDAAPYRADGRRRVAAGASGVLQGIGALAVGQAARVLGAGRAKADDSVYSDVGVEILCAPGDEVSADTPIAILYGRTDQAIAEAEALIRRAIRVGETNDPRPASRVREELGAE